MRYNGTSRRLVSNHQRTSELMPYVIVDFLRNVRCHDSQDGVYSVMTFQLAFGCQNRRETP